MCPIANRTATEMHAAGGWGRTAGVGVDFDLAVGDVDDPVGGDASAAVGRGEGAVGGLILWFGWYGFNPGSTLSAMDFQGIGRVAANTTLAACAAAIPQLFLSRRALLPGRRPPLWTGPTRRRAPRGSATSEAG